MIFKGREAPGMEREVSMKNRQAGAATLFVTVIILALLTVIAVVSAKIGMFELKTAANTNRAKEALQVAQGGLDYGAIRYLDDASWAGESLEMPYGGPGASVSVSATTSTNSVLIEAQGESLDETGLARVEEKFARVPIIDVGELPPLMANGNFPDHGGFSIITNPNGGGPGVPVSGWTELAVKQGQANWRTCNVDEWLYQDPNDTKAKQVQSDGFTLCDTCNCNQVADPICAPKDVADGDTIDCPDIVVEDPDDIPDVFENLFGVKPGDLDSNGIDDWYEFIEAIATVRFDGSDCFSKLGPNTGDQFYGSGANAGKLPLIWVDATINDCNLPNSGKIASYDKPIILFVHGNIKSAGSPIFYGILFGFSDKYGNAPDDQEFDVDLSGSPVIYGVILTNRSLEKATGGYTLVYAQKLLEKLVNVDDTFYELARYPGSWTDTK